MSVERTAEAAVARFVAAIAAALRERMPDAEIEEADGAVRVAGRGVGRRLIEDGDLKGFVR
jgi:hypothetical protein